MWNILTKVIPTPVLLCLIAGCAQHRIPSEVGPITEPRASWSIRAGKSLNEREVCSSDADRPCVLTASSDKEPVSVVVSVYLHPIGDAQTMYHGEFVASFMGTAQRMYEQQVDMTIEPGGRPTGIATAGLVTPTAGRYVFQMSLFASVATQTDPHQFEQTIPVEVIVSS